jgi:hypothetical protein
MISRDGRLLRVEGLLRPVRDQLGATKLLELIDPKPALPDPFNPHPDMRRAWVIGAAFLLLLIVVMTLWTWGRPR